MEVESKSSMAAKTMHTKKKPAPTLPVSVEKNNHHHQPQEAHAAPPRPFLDVKRVNQWTFANAFIITIDFGILVAYMSITDDGHHRAASPPAPWWLLRAAATMLTDAERSPAAFAVLVGSVGMMWCSTPQAAAAALALLLPSHRWRARRAAAYAALALAVAGHCMFAGVVLVLIRAEPCRVCTIVCTAGIFVCALGDLLGFLVLLREEWGRGT